MVSEESLIQIWSRILKNNQVLLPDGPKCGISIYLVILKLSFVIYTEAYISPKSAHYIKDNQ